MAFFTALVVASAAISAYSAYKQQSAANDAADYNAGVERRKAEVSDALAASALKKGRFKELRFRNEVDRFKGKQRTSYGAAGVVVDSGSSLDTVIDTTVLGNQDAMTIRHNTAMDVWGYKQEGINYRQSANMIEGQKQDPLKAGGMALLGSGMQLAAQYSTSQKRS